MRISLITAIMLVSSAANAQQQPSIQVPVPNIPGITTPSQPQQRPYYPPAFIISGILLIIAAIMVLFVGAGGRIHQREIVATSPL